MAENHQKIEKFISTAEDLRSKGLKIFGQYGNNTFQNGASLIIVILISDILDILNYLPRDKPQRGKNDDEAEVISL